MASQQFLVGVYFKKAFVDLVVQYRCTAVCTSQRLDGLHEWRESNHMSYENFRATASSIADKWSCKILSINLTWRWTPATKISKMCDVGFGWMREITYFSRNIHWWKFKFDAVRFRKVPIFFVGASLYFRFFLLIFDHF